MESSVRKHSGRAQARAMSVAATCLLILVALMGAGGPTRAQASGLRVGVLETTTQAGYSAWSPSSGGPPSHLTNTFPHGTKLVGMYFEIDSGTPHRTTFQLKIRTASGEIISSAVGTVSYVNSIHMVPLSLTSYAKPGVWTITLLVNGKAMATHPFTLK